MLRLLAVPERRETPDDFSRLTEEACDSRPSFPSVVVLRRFRSYDIHPSHLLADVRLCQGVTAVSSMAGRFEQANPAYSRAIFLTFRRRSGWLVLSLWMLYVSLALFFTSRLLSCRDDACTITLPPPPRALPSTCHSHSRADWHVHGRNQTERYLDQALGHLVRNIRHVMMFQTSPGVPYAGEQEMRENVRFHSELVLRHLRASSLPMRLWGWEQTEDLINHSHRHRWNAKAYLVSRRLGRGGRGGGSFPGMSVVVLRFCVLVVLLFLR